MKRIIVLTVIVALTHQPLLFVVQEKQRMKVRVESASPDGMRVYIDKPIFIMTWEELTPLLKIIDKLHYTKNLKNLVLRDVLREE